MLYRAISLLLALLLNLSVPARFGVYPVRAESAVVRAILFYSPSCPHCHLVIQEVLPPLFEQYGEQLEMVGIETSTPGGSALFEAAVQRFAIPPERQAVPMLIVGETILLGSYEIPEQFPGLIERHLAQGGIDWPDIPGLVEELAAVQPEPSAAPTPTLTLTVAPQAEVQETAVTQPEPSPTVVFVPESSPTATPSGLILTGDSDPGLGERMARDPLGNSMAIVVLLGMLISILAAFKMLGQAASSDRSIRPSIWIPALCLIGLAVAGYLAFVEMAQVEAVCGPVGDCNTVQQSEYARLFGVLPVGVLGLVGYITILGAWFLGRYGSESQALLGSLALLGMTLFGVLFSIYLTYLEPFVIGASCAWCLTSAVIMTALLWCSLAPGKAALLKIKYGEEYAHAK